MGILDAARRSPVCLALAGRARDRAALVDEGRTISFGELGERIELRAAALRGAGLDGLVALAWPNSAALVESFFALRALGHPVLLTDAGAAPETARRLGAAWTLRPSGPERLGPAVPMPAGTEIAKVTSGSTLDPRGACFREEALVHGFEHLRRGMELSERDVVLIAIPLSHSYGFDNGILSLAFAGTTLVLQSDVLPAALARAIRERAVTFLPAVPAIVRALGHAGPGGPTSLRSVICASAPLAREDADRFAAAWGLPVRQFFGATEAGGISFETRPEEAASAGTVGFPLPGVRVEPHEGGLRVHSKALRHALLPGGEAAEGPVETGDLAELTPEGRLRLLGRAKLVANVGGHKVDLGALDAFFRGLPGVAEAAAVPVEDAARGHRIVAWVESRDQSPERLLELCRGRLSAREVPHEIRVVAELPRTGRGKLDRAALAKESR